MTMIRRIRTALGCEQLVKRWAFCAGATSVNGNHDSLQLRAGKFSNPVAMQKQSLGEMIRIRWTLAFNKSASTVPEHPITVRPVTRTALLEAADNTLYRLPKQAGHDAQA